jgi:hypothetical protein
MPPRTLAGLGAPTSGAAPRSSARRQTISPGASGRACRPSAVRPPPPRPRHSGGGGALSWRRVMPAGRRRRKKARPSGRGHRRKAGASWTRSSARTPTGGRPLRRLVGGGRGWGMGVLCFPPRMCTRHRRPAAAAPLWGRQRTPEPRPPACRPHARPQGQAGAKRASYEARWGFFAARPPEGPIHFDDVPWLLPSRPGAETGQSEELRGVVLYGEPHHAVACCAALRCVALRCAAPTLARIYEPKAPHPSALGGARAAQAV